MINQKYDNLTAVDGAAVVVAAIFLIYPKVVRWLLLMLL